MKKRVMATTLVLLGILVLAMQPVGADAPCSGLPSHTALAAALATARAAANGGFTLDM